jgi:hypothetical protein
LLTDGVPAEVPYVAGIISLAPATPNSHVAVFAGANDIPFAYVADKARQEQVRQWDGHEIVFRAGIRYGYSQVTVADVEGKLDDAARAELLALKAPVPADIGPKQHYGQLSANAEGLMPQDRQYFGGKAANYGILRRMVPNNSEPAIAFSFDLWDAFMDQTIPGSPTLREIIHTRLASFTNYPPDIVAVQTNLAGIRDLITDVATFTPEQQQAIINALAPFDPPRRSASAVRAMPRTARASSEPAFTTVSAAVSWTTSTAIRRVRANVIPPSPRSVVSFARSGKRTPASTTTMLSWNGSATASTNHRWPWGCWSTIQRRTKRRWRTGWPRSITKCSRMDHVNRCWRAIW